MESLRNAINEHLTSFIEDHQKRLTNAEAATVRLEIDGEDDVIFVLILFECHGLLPVEIEPLTDLDERGKKLTRFQSYGDHMHLYNPYQPNFYRISGCS
jgi:hypothetical protein